VQQTVALAAQWGKHTHTSTTRAIMDSGNNVRHSFKSLSYFPLGVDYHYTDITGVHGKQRVRVGIGTACFTTVCSDGSVVQWLVPESVYNPGSPVNLLCMNRFHRHSDGKDTGHEWSPKQEKLTLNDGRVVHVSIDKSSQLPLVEIKPVAECDVACIGMESNVMLQSFAEHDAHTPPSPACSNTHTSPPLRQRIFLKFSGSQVSVC